MKIKNMILVATLLLFPFSSFASFDKDLFYGMRDDQQISELQEFLAAEDLYFGLITGNFYSLTLQAVKNFQERENIAKTGYFGPLTRARANQILKDETAIKSDDIKSGNEQEKEIKSDNTASDLQKKIEALTLQIKLLQQEINKKQSNKESASSQGQSTNSNFVTLSNGAIAKTDSNGNITTYVESKSSPSAKPQSSSQDMFQSTKPRLFVMLLNNSLSVASSSNEQILAKFQVTVKEEKLSSSNISFKFNTNNQGGKISDITDLMLVDQNGGIVAGPKEGTGDKEGSVLFTDTVTFQKGTHIFTLKGKMRNNFASGQVIYTSLDADSWSAVVPQETKYIPPFQAAEMGVYVFSQSIEKNNSDNFIVKITFTSLTELNSLTIRLKNKEDNSLFFTQNAVSRNDKKTYDVEFQNIPRGNYTLDMIADATGLIGVVKTFTVGYLVN